MISCFDFIIRSTFTILALLSVIWSWLPSRILQNKPLQLSLLDKDFDVPFQLDTLLCYAICPISLRYSKNVESLLTSVLILQKVSFSFCTCNRTCVREVLRAWTHPSSLDDYHPGVLPNNYHHVILVGSISFIAPTLFFQLIPLSFRNHDL